MSRADETRRKLEALAAEGWVDAPDPGTDRRAQALCEELGPALHEFADDWLHARGVTNESIVRPLVRINCWVGMLSIELGAACGSKEQLLQAIATCTAKIAQAAVHAWETAESQRERDE